MAFKQIKAKHRNFPEGYWEKRKLEQYAKDSKGKIRFWKASRVASENVSNVTSITHREGAWVQFKNDKPAQVLRVEPKGVWLQEYELKGDEGIIDKTKTRIYFVPEKEYEKHAESFYFSFPNPLFMGAYFK